MTGFERIHNLTKWSTTISELRLGIIGAGHITWEHLKVIQAMDKVRISGITSRTLSKAQELSEVFSIGQVFESPTELINRCSVDGLLVLVSADQIFTVVKQLLPAQLPLFIEKPPGLAPEQTKILTELADKHKTQTMVGYNRRFYSVFQKGLDLIHQYGSLRGVSVEGHERFWKITDLPLSHEIRENWIYANSTHTIDLLRLFGGEVVSVHSVHKNVQEKKGDQFIASMEFDSGVLGSYTSHWYSPGGWSVKLYGDGVTVEFKPLEQAIWIDTEFNENEINPDELDVKYKPGFYKQMEAYVNMVKTGKLDWPGMGLEDSYRTMRLAEKISCT